ncbi:hypothetical protein BaRGS_00021983 [Batillaria attramentaria]|uniref:Uncharacterized protein n=1 Tax=Batillaria attramentaria TaxID=370345 RepID=A0ABD0KHZ4_9CAEN
MQPQLGFQTYTGSLTFLPGESQKLITLTVLSDDTPEVNEEYQLRLTDISTEGVGPTGAAIISPQFGTVLITIAGSNDPHGVVQFATTSLSLTVAEDAGVVSLQLDRKFGAIGRVQVLYQVIQGTLSALTADLSLAVPGQDFVAVSSGTIELADGATSGTIPVTIINDLIAEIDELFLVQLMSVTLVGSVDDMSPPRLASNGTIAEVTIGANDGAQGVIELATDSRSISVDEVSPSISLTVVRTQGQFGEVSVMYNAESITAVPNVDFILAPGVLVFAAGESRKTINIQIINDNIPEPTEEFEVVLSNPQNGATLSQNSRATVRILANDASAGQVFFASELTVQLREPRGVNDTESKAELTVQRGPGVFGRVTVPFVITNSFGIRSSDVTPASGEIVFEDRQGQAVVEVTAVNDDEPESEEAFELRLQAPSGGATLGAITTARIIVASSDSPNGLFEIFPINSRVSSLNVEENVGTIQLEVVRTQGLEGRVSLDVTTAAGTATFLSSSDNVVLADFQSVPASRVSGWHDITVGETTFVLMLTSFQANVRLRDFLPASSPVEDGQSVLFRWQGELTYVRTLATDGATAATSFTIGGSTYFVIASSGKEGAREIQSIVYRLDADGAVEVVQGLTTSGAADVKYYVDNGQHYLVFANSLDDSSRSDISTYIYMWDNTTQKFGSSPTQTVSTLYAKSVEVFVINRVVYMAVANYYDRASGSYEIDSIVYRKDTDGSFVQHQRLPTTGAADLAYVVISNVHYLVIGNNRQNTISSPQTSHVYRWDPATQRFVQHQEILTSRVQAVRTLTMDDGRVLLAVANMVGASEILQWDVSQSRFTPVWSGDPYLLLEPIRIQQTSTPLYLMAAADVITDHDGMLYQVSHISDQSDFVPRIVTLTFWPTQTVLHTTVVVLQDDTPEDTETFTVRLADPVGGADIGVQGAVTINILSNDNAHGIIQFAADSVNVVAEERDSADNTILLNVVRQAGFFGRVAVQWVASGDHDGEADISPLAGRVEFANGQSVATIALTIKDDSVAEFAEVTYVRLTQILDDGTSLPSKGAQLGEATQATVTVLANDSPFGVVSWNVTSATTSEPEGQNLDPHRRQGTSTSMALELPEQQRATSGEDFVSTQGSVTFPPDSTQAFVQIVIKQDTIPEASEMFYVNLTAVELVGTSGGSGAGPSIKKPGDVVQVTILENDNARGTVQFDVSTNVENRIDTYEEYGRNNTISLQLRRSADPITANILDYFPSSGTVSFADGQQTADIIITIVDDQLAEAMESFEVKLISVSGDAVLGSSTSVTIAILKNDSPTGSSDLLTDRQVQIREPVSTGDVQGQAQLRVQRVQGTEGLVNVQWRLSAEAQDDFVPPLEGTLSFNPGVLEQTLTLQSRADGVLEGRETFLVSLVSADNNADISPTEGDATVIVLPDPGASGTISIVPDSRNVLIGEPGEYSPAYDGTVDIVLSRATGIFGEVVVTWALTPRDTTAFMQVEGSVTFLDLQQTATITLQARDDSTPELRTSFTLQINSASGGAVISTESGAAEARVTYVASDYPHGLFEFSLPETVSVSEELANVQVYYTTSDGTATSGQDYFPNAGVLVFENGVDAKGVQVSLISDSTPEGPETFFINITSVTLLNPSDSDFTMVNGLLPDMPPDIGPVSVKTVVIEKNDNAEGVIEFDNSATPFTVQEEAGVAQIPVIRRQGSYGAVNVSYTTQPITASSGVDYLPASDTLRLEDGQSEAVINVTLQDDSDPEFAEQFSITLSNPRGGVLLGSFRTAVVTIVKSDYPNGKFSFLGETERRVPNPSATEILVFYVQRTERLLGQQEVFWRIMGPNNPNLQLEDTSDISYTSGGAETTSGRLPWGDGEAGTKQFMLNVKPYTSWEIQKVFVIEMYDIQGSPASVGNGEISPTNGKIVLTIEKFGDPNGIIEFTGVASTDREAEEPAGDQPSQLGFPVVRQTGTGTTGVVQIHWEVRGAGAEVTDVRPTNGTLLLADGQRQGQITLQVLPDDLPELTERFSLVLTAAEGGAEINAQASTAVFSIRYNDNPHGLFGVRSENQEVLIDPVDLSRSLLLNFTRYFGTFGSTILTYTVDYDDGQAGVVLASKTGTVTFNNGKRNVQTTVAIQGAGFLALGSTFSLSLVDVTFVGDGVTQPPQLRAGETDAKIVVHDEAANSIVSFATTVINVDDESGTATLTVTRQGTYGSVSIDWTAGELVGNLPAGVVNGQITPPSGFVSLRHGLESKNFTVQVNARIGQAETFTLRLPRAPQTPVSGGARLAGQNLVATLDPSGVLRIMPSSSQPEVSELDRQVTVSVARVYGVQDRVEFTYSTEDDTATANFDYRPVDRGIIMMQPYQATANISVTHVAVQVFEDDIPETSELFHINLVQVDKLPTPTQPVVSPRIDSRFSQAVVTIKESNDPYGVLWIQADTDSIEEGFTTVTLNVRRTGGTFGTVSVRVRTVGGGEAWSSDIVPNTENTTADTIAQALGQRNSENVASAGEDYQILDNQLTFQNRETEKSVTVQLLDDQKAEPMETVLVYLTGVTGGARVAEGTTDGGIRGYAVITIQRSDTSNGIICFAENSKNVQANEDVQPITRLTLTRLNAFFGDLVSVEDDARLGESCRFATVTVLPSDDVRGLVQFVANSRVRNVGDNTESVRLGVERVQGLEFDIAVGYRTEQMGLTTTAFDVTISPALDGEDFIGQQGTLVFRARSEEVQYVDVKLTPLMASSNPYPKQFYLVLQSPTNGARINPDFQRAVVRIVREDEVATWNAVTSFNNSFILPTLGLLDGVAQDTLSDTEVTVFNYIINEINEKGSNQRHPDEVLNAMLDLLCKMLDPSKVDGTRGRHQLAAVLEKFAYTMLTDRPCPSPQPTSLLTKQCPYVVVSTARWPASSVEGFYYEAQRSDYFEMPDTMTLSTGADGTVDECVDFHIIEYNSRQWFPTRNGEQLLNNRILSIGFKGRDSAPISEPVKFRVHTPDRRIATKRAQCVYFETSAAQWTNPGDVCSVTNNLNMGTDDFVDCSCKHMTSYGVIAQGYDPGIIGYTIWFYIACFICLSCLFLVIVAHHLCYQRPTFAASLLQHMLFAAFATHVCLVVDAYLSPSEILVANTSVDNYRCIVMGLFLHYFFLAQFTWIMVQAVNFWKILVTNDEHTERNFIVFFLLGWGVPLVAVAIFYAVTFNVYKYHTDLHVDFIYGDVNNNAEICFMTNAYAAVGGVLPQWQAYDDIYRNRYNITEVRLLLLLWSLLVLTWLWGGLHMAYGQLWMLILFCICDILQGLLALVLYAILRNPCLMRCIPGHKTSYYNPAHSDVGALPTPAPDYGRLNVSAASIKGSRTSLINEAWERSTPGTRSQMTVKRALPSQVYINPPIAIVSPAATSDLDPQDFDELLHALKTGHSYTPSEMSRSIDDDDSQLSTKLDRYETKRIDIADTHL